MNTRMWNFTKLMVFLVFVLGPLVFLGFFFSSRSSGYPGPPQSDDGWQVKSVGGMALDAQNSNVYLTSSVTMNNSTSSETRCLIRMLSFSPEEGFASVHDHSVFPKGASYDWLHGHEVTDLVCPGDPRCVVRRQLMEDFQVVDESVYPEICSKIYVRSNQVIVLGRIRRSGKAGGSVMILPLDAHKIDDGNNNHTQEFRPPEEPLAAAFDGDDTIYIVSHPHSHSSAIILSRYSNSEQGWQLGFRADHFLSSGHSSHRIHVSSLNVILGGRYLVLAGTVSEGSGRSSALFRIYNAHDQSMVEDLQDPSSIIEADPSAHKHTIECVCLDEENSNATVAIVYQLSTFEVQDVPVSRLKKLRLERDGNGMLRHSTVWTQDIIRASIKKCHMDNGALVLAGFSYVDGVAVFRVSKHSATNGAELWTTQEAAPSSSDLAPKIHLADATMDQQGHVLVYGQWVGEVVYDIGLLQAFHGTSGNVLASSDGSPKMLVKETPSSSIDRNIKPEPRAIHVMSREEILANYHIPMIILIVGFVVTVMLGICVTCIHKANTNEKEKESFQTRLMNIFSYLRPFQANEVDMQQSPTGGFNATYTNDISGIKQESETEPTLSSRL